MNTPASHLEPYPYSLQHQRALARVIVKIRESLELDTIFQTTTAEVRQLLEVDRVGVVQLDPATGWDSGKFVAESVLPSFDAVLARRVQDHCFGEDYAAAYANGRIHTLNDVNSADISECHREILAQFQVRANLLAPLHLGDQLWGLLCVHQCSGPRAWQSFEVDFVAHIANHLSIAIQQSQLLATTRQQAETLADTLNNLQMVQLQLIQAEKMSTMGQLAAGVAHEINNPVNFILGNLFHLRHHTQDLLHMVKTYQKYCPKGIDEVEAAIANLDIDFVTTDVPDILDSMTTGARRIQSIVKTLQNFTRLDEAGLKWVDLNQSLDSILAMVQHRLVTQAQRPEIQLLKTYGKVPKIEGVPAALNQALMNIVTNAIDALDGHMVRSSKPPSTLDGSAPRIHISTDQQDAHITITIANNGPSIPEHVADRLFEPFFSTKPIGQGTGMGLAISQQIIDFHQGTLHYQHKSDVGTTFLVSLPVESRSS